MLVVPTRGSKGGETKGMRLVGEIPSTGGAVTSHRGNVTDEAGTYLYGPDGPEEVLQLKVSGG